MTFLENIVNVLKKEKNFSKFSVALLKAIFWIGYRIRCFEKNHKMHTFPISYKNVIEKTWEKLLWHYPAIGLYLLVFKISSFIIGNQERVISSEGCGTQLVWLTGLNADSFSVLDSPTIIFSRFFLWHFRECSILFQNSDCANPSQKNTVGVQRKVSKHVSFSFANLHQTCFQQLLDTQYEFQEHRR